MPADELILDPDVLSTEPLLEFGGHVGASHTRGLAVLPWRRESLRAREAGADCVALAEEIASDGRFGQALVHLQKSRPATFADLAAAWRHLRPGGRLLLGGGNELGITSAVKKLGQMLDREPIVLSNRARARIVAFERSEGPGPIVPDTPRIELPDPRGGEAVPLVALPGVFSARKLDAGTRLLLDALDRCAAPSRVFDPGSGIGPLAVSAMLRWPECRATLLDADARATRSARANLDALGLSDRADVHWWDAHEACPDSGFDLALVNPPFHTGHHGKAVDLSVARAIFARLAEALGPGARALIVANRSLPYEAELDPIGHVEVLAQAQGYKLLEVRRKARRRRDAGPRRR